MLSQTVEYALRAVVFLANENPEPRTTGQIAEHTMVPVAYLSKVMQGLVRARMVRSQRGLRGGFTLLKSPEEVTLLDVVNAVEPILRIHECPLGIKSHGFKLCPLHRRLDDAMAQVEASFANTTLAEVLAERDGSVPLCEAVN